MFDWMSLRHSLRIHCTICQYKLSVKLKPIAHSTLFSMQRQQIVGKIEKKLFYKNRFFFFNVIWCKFCQGQTICKHRIENMKKMFFSKKSFFFFCSRYPPKINHSIFLFWIISFVFTTFITFRLALERSEEEREKITHFFCSSRIYQTWEMNVHLFPTVYTLIKSSMIVFGFFCCCCCCGCCGTRNK